MTSYDKITQKQWQIKIFCNSTKVNGRHLSKEGWENMRTRIYVRLIAKGKSFVDLVLMFTKLIDGQYKIGKLDIVI